MKKNKKLNLKKNIISNFQLSKIVGGTTQHTIAESNYCGSYDTSQNVEIC